MIKIKKMKHGYILRHNHSLRYFERDLLLKISTNFLKTSHLSWPQSCPWHRVLGESLEEAGGKGRHSSTEI